MADADAEADIDAVVARFFLAFDNRGGRRPRMDDIACCFAEGAVVVRHALGRTEMLAVPAFAAPRIDLLSSGDLVEFHEWEVESSTRVFGGIASRTSRYGKRGLLQGSTYSGSGTKLFHLACSDSTWLITSLAWMDDPA